MPRCLECNKILPRLQWTHFMHKCTGRFKNSKEYKEVYPDAKLVDDDLAKRASVTKRGLMGKYGEEEGLIRWESYCNRQAITNTFEYKQKKYGWTKEQFDEYNKSRAVTVENMVNRHGEEEGLRQWMEYCNRQAYTNTLDYFIEREGSEEKGLAFYNSLNIEKMKAMDPAWIMERYNVDMDGALEILSSRYTPSFVSEGEKYFIDLLEKELGEQIKYTYKTKQYCVWSHELDAPLFYDAVCSKRKKAIEYNGDYWHANPLLYESSVVIKQTGRTAKEIWDRDQIKIKALTDRGYEVKIIWESEFLENENIIKEVAEWLKK